MGSLISKSLKGSEGLKNSYRVYGEDSERSTRWEFHKDYAQVRN